MLNQNADGKMASGMSMSSSMPILSIPKVVMPSTYYKPSPVNRASINLIPSVSKGLSQQVGPSNIKNYMSTVKKATIDLISDIQPSRHGNMHSKDLGQTQKVRFSTLDTF